MPLLEEEGQLPYWSLASGFLTGKYRPGGRVESARAGGASKYLDDPKNVALLGCTSRAELGHRHGTRVSSSRDA